MGISLPHLQHIAAITEEAVRLGPAPTAVVAIANSRETVYTHVVPGKDGVALDSIFLLASITKPIVATAVMRLVEEGKLMLSVPVAHYLPELAQNGKEKVTTFHLLTHSSGMEERAFWLELERMGERRPPPAWLFEACCRSYLHWEPGTRYQYSTLPFSVLSELITRLGGLPCAAYLQEHIFGPLGMASTGFRPSDQARAAPVHGFASPDHLERFVSLAQPGGGLWSTAADLVRFGQAYLRGGGSDGHRLLAPSTIEAMTRHYTKGQINAFENKPFNYGLGWGKPAYPFTGDNLGSERAYSHHGSSGTMLHIDPEHDLICVFLSNLWGYNDPSDVKGRVLNVAYSAIG